MTSRHAQPRLLLAALGVMGALPLATAFAPTAGASHGRHSIPIGKTHHGQLAGTSNNMTYNGGPVMLTSTTYAIYREPATLQDGAATHVSATYNSLIQRYFGDVGGSGLYNNTQYYRT